MQNNINLFCLDCLYYKYNKCKNTETCQDNNLWDEGLEIDSSKNNSLSICNEKCINCGNPATQWHHIIPKSLGGNNIKHQNLVPLCDKCHGLIHNIKFENKGLSHSELTKIGLRKARENGKHLGLRKGTKLITHKSMEAKKIIIEQNKDFNGSLSNEQTMKLANISRNTFYKYKKELLLERKNSIEVK